MDALWLQVSFNFPLSVIGNIAGVCEAGFWCKSGSAYPRPNKTETVTAYAGPCPKGYYCPIKTIDPVPCPNGTFKAYEGGKGTLEDCLPCPAGQECFTGISDLPFQLIHSQDIERKLTSLSCLRS